VPVDALPPLIFRPVYQHYLWGGDWLRRRYRPELTAERTAESWEVSAHPDGLGAVESGPFAGRTLPELIAAGAEVLLGPGRTTFPWLVKLLDARAHLSLQVHPDEASAPALGGEPKTEMWQVLDAEPEARIYAGLRPEVGEAEVRAACAAGRLVDCLRVYPARAGDTFFIPGGRVHAIGAGCRILEIQQSSNTTYRLDDWGRVGPDGRPRELHLDAGLRAIRWRDARPARVLPALLQERRDLRRWLHLETPFFRLERLEFSGVWSPVDRPEGFEVLFLAKGAARVENPAGAVALPAGRSVLLPARPRAYGVITAEGGPVELFRVLAPAARPTAGGDRS
jgi:mannose-6-phosphate isomerase